MTRFLVLVLGLFFVRGAIADDGAKLVGIWKLTAFDVEFQQSGNRQAAFGGRKSSGSPGRWDTCRTRWFPR